jgi:glutamine synthetase
MSAIISTPAKNPDSPGSQRARIEEVQQRLAAQGVKFVLAQFVDIHGVAKAKSVPLAHLADVVTGGGAGFAGFAVWGLAMQPHDPDFMARGDLDTVTLLPWQPGYARIVCVGHVNDEPYPFDTRWILMQQVEQLRIQGLTCHTGLEPEFMLLARSADGSLGPADATDNLDKPCYDYKGLSRSRRVLESLVSSLVAAGLDIYQIDHEDANGQFEINFTYSDALTSADHMVLLRMAAGEIAAEHGVICSFMPKPLTHRTGSGMHMHLSLAEEGRNLFVDPGDPQGFELSAMAYHFLAGLLAHAPALTALCAPTVNSYKRLVVGRSLSGATWAPAYISYGNNNRTSMVRIAAGRIELRVPDSGCNPYLATAAAIAAGKDGIQRRLDPGPARNFNHYDCTSDELRELGIGLLPQSLDEAIDALEADSLFHEQLGPQFIAEFCRLKRMEWTEYQRHVSDWELRQYLEFF